MIRSKIFPYLYPVISLLAVLASTLILLIVSPAKNLHGTALFEFRDIRKNRIRSSQLLNRGCVLIVCLDPDCSACRGEVRGIAADTPLLNQVSLLLVAESRPAMALAFFNTLPNYLKSHSIMINDSAGSSQRYFGKHVLPSTYFYSPGGSLMKIWRGEVSKVTLDKNILKSRTIISQ
jgi:hypothetical protein